MKERMEAALTDVRRAYRLVHTYQKNVYHTVNRIKDEFDSQFYWWTPVGYRPPPQRGTYLANRWAWDMLPMYCISFQFIKEGSSSDERQAGDWLLDITLEVDGDNGWDEAKTGGEPNAAKFNPVEECQSWLSMYMSFCTEPCKLNWYYGYWNNIEYSDEEVLQPGDFPQITQVHSSIELAELYNEEKILEFVANYKSLLQTHLPDEPWS